MPGVQESPPCALAAEPGSSAHFSALILAQNRGWSLWGDPINRGEWDRAPHPTLEGPAVGTEAQAEGKHLYGQRSGCPQLPACSQLFSPEGFIMLAVPEEERRRSSPSSQTKTPFAAPANRVLLGTCWSLPSSDPLYSSHSFPNQFEGLFHPLSGSVGCLLAWSYYCCIPSLAM